MGESTEFLAYNVRNTLRKPSEIPVVNGWKIAESEVLASSRVLCFYKYKGLLWDRRSEICVRHVTILKSGHLLLYLDERLGFVLDLRRVTETVIRSRKMPAGKEPQRRCDMQLRFRFGSVHLHLVDEEVSKWRKAIEKVDEKMVVEKRRRDPDEISQDLITIYPSEGEEESDMGSEAAFAVSTRKSESIKSLTASENELVTVTEKNDDEVEDSKYKEVEVEIDSQLEQEVEDSVITETLIASPITVVAAKPVDVEYQSGTESSSCSGLFTEEETLNQAMGPSIRTGYATVKLLKQKMESKIENAKRSMTSKDFYTAPSN